MSANDNPEETGVCDYTEGLSPTQEDCADNGCDLCRGEVDEKYGLDQ